jgi:hypothetical protein
VNVSVKMCLGFLKKNPNATVFFARIIAQINANLQIISHKTVFRFFENVKRIFKFHDYNLIFCSNPVLYNRYIHFKGVIIAGV